MNNPRIGLRGVKKFRPHGQIFLQWVHACHQENLNELRTICADLTQELLDGDMLHVRICHVVLTVYPIKGGV